MAMNPKLMRPKKRGTRRNEIVDIEWTADGGSLYSKPGGQSFEYNAPTWLIDACFNADYGGTPFVVDNGSSGNNYRYRVTFQDGLGKQVELADVDLYTTQTAFPSISTIIEGSEEIVGAIEIFEVTLAELYTGTVEFGNGFATGEIFFNSGLATIVETPAGFSASGEGSPVVTFTGTEPHEHPAFGITFNNTATTAILTTIQEGATPVTATQEIQEINIDGANHGDWGIIAMIDGWGTIGGPVNIPALEDATGVESYINTYIAHCLVVGDPGGPYTVTFFEQEDIPQMMISESHTLEVRTSRADSIVVSVVQQGG